MVQVEAGSMENHIVIGSGIGKRYRSVNGRGIDETMIIV